MELNELCLRTVKNAFVSGSFSLFSADDIETICGLFVRTSSASASANSLMSGNTLDPCTVSIGLDFFASAASQEARAESCDQRGRKSTKSIRNRPSRVVVKSSTYR